MKEIIEIIENNIKGSKWLVISDGVMLIIILVIAGTFFFQFNNISSLKNEVSSSTQLMIQRIASLEADMDVNTLANLEISEQLKEQQNQTEDFQNTIEDISGTVGTLEKLSKTDKELLQKYSRVYFLSDNYVPMQLDTLDEQYLYDQSKALEFHAYALPFLERMLRRAIKSGIDLKVISAYRSFGTQSTLKSNYLTTYGSGSNQFSADQGYSEHQLGTAVDITIEGLIPSLVVAFEGTPGFTWLSENAYKYGFILSYPKDNSFYQYEPWHWRFVGVDLATKLYDEEIDFSDMDQREIDKYLANIFE